jgi:hypothetical protein
MWKKLFYPFLSMFFLVLFSLEATVNLAYSNVFSENHQKKNVKEVLERAGSISGLVTDENSNGLGNITVQAYDLHDNWINDIGTDASGHYWLGGIPGGTYKIQFWANNQNYVSEWYNDKVGGTADTVLVQENQTTENINAQLAFGGSISGQVTDGTGTPVANVDVVVFNMTNNWLNSMETDVNGNYQLNGFAAGSYKVRFNSNNPLYAMEWYNNQPTAQHANAVTVIVGNVSSGINAVLKPGASISGRIYDENNNGIENVSVQIYDLNCQFLMGTSSEANGNYSIGCLSAGNYKIQYETNTAPNYVCEWYNDQSNFESADAIMIETGQNLTDINAQLATGGAISGKVMNEDLIGLENIGVGVHSSSGQWLAGCGTDSQGDYLIGNLPVSADYKISFYAQGIPGNYVNEWYNNKQKFEQADGVAVTAGNTTSNINAVLAVGGSISGRVIDANTGQGIGSIINVNVHDMNQQWIAAIQPNTDGYYVLTGIPVGDFKVCFQTNNSTGNYLEQWFCNQPDFNSAQTLTITPGQNLVDINAAMIQCGVIAGWVTDGNGNGIENVQVNIYTLDHQSKQSLNTDSSGHYTLRFVLPGDYKIFFNSSYIEPQYHSEWYDNQSQFAAAAVVTVAPDQLINGIDAELTAITDDSFDPNNEFSQAAEVTAGVYENLMLLNPETDMDWFKLYIDESFAGKDLKIQLTVTSPYPDYPPSWWNSDLDFYVIDENGHPLAAVISGSDDETIYLSNPKTGWIYICLNYSSGYYGPEGTFSGTEYRLILEAGTAQSFGIGYVTGRVTNDQGEGIPYVVINMAHYPNDHNHSWPLLATDANGYYTIGYTPGNYSLFFNDRYFSQLDPSVSWPNYAVEYYHDIPYGAANSMNWVTIEAGQTITANESLQTGGKISGRITNDQGQGVRSSVYVFDLHGNQVGYSVLSTADGYYTLEGIPAGKVKLMQGRIGSYNVGLKWYPNFASFNEGQEVTVIADQTIADINWISAVGGMICGRVTDTTGNPIANVRVLAFLENWDDVYKNQSSITNANGEYTVKGLSSRSYKLLFVTSAANGNFVTHYYGNTLDIDQAIPVAATEGQTVSGINIALPAAGSIKGRVVDELGQGAAYIRVQAYHGLQNMYLTSGSVFTNANGEYEIKNIPFGLNKLYFNDFYKITDFAHSFYLGKDSLATADAIDVQSTTPVIVNDTVLLTGGAVLSGRITLARRSEVGFPVIYLYDAVNQSVVQYAYGDSQGYYCFQGIPAGNYKVLVSYKNILPSEWCGDTLQFAQAKTVSIGQNENVTLNMVLGGPDEAQADSIVGVFPGIGIWNVTYQQGVTNWIKWSSLQPDMIRMGDVDGNGFDDLACWFKSDKTFWIRYDSGQWVKVPASAADMICFDLGDLNKDGKADILGSWTFGTWWKNTASSTWEKLSNMSPSYLASGDFDGDGADDMVGLYPSLNSLWIYSRNGSPQWRQISKQINLNDLRSGDFDHDGKADVLGSWNIGTWSFNPITNVWVQHSKKQASVLCAGDINNQNADDIIGDWSPDVAGLWVKLLESNTWKQLSKKVPLDLTSGKTRD